MSIDALTAVLPPPPAPVEVSGAGGWAKAEAELGAALPADYKAFIERYGTGLVAGFIRPFNPFAASPHRHLKTQVDTQLDALGQLKAKWPDEVPFPLFPEEGGLVPWGRTDNGDILHWKTVGPPDGWPVVVTASRDSRFQEFAETMTAFLAGILMKELTCSVFPDDFPPDALTFVPAKKA